MAASVRCGGPCRDLREQHRAEHVDVGDDRAAGRFGQQLGADPLTGPMRPGVGVNKGASGGPPQAFVESHPVPERISRPHGARERVRAELLAEAAGGPVVTGSDVFGAVLLADLAAASAAADDGGHD